VGPTKIPIRVRNDHTKVDATLVWCIDSRFRAAIWSLEKTLGIKHSDVLKVDGGDKVLVNNGYARRFILERLEVSVKLHDPKVIYSMFHFDCGAYKPLRLPKGQNEKIFLELQGKKAKKALKDFKLPVKIVIVDFNELTILD
jgi:hypothetical protein